MNKQSDTLDTLTEKSEAQQKFEAGLKSVLRVSKQELDAKLAEQKQTKQTASAPNEA